MKIKTANNKEEWNVGVNNFAQSWEWGGILLSEGKKVERLIVEENKEVLVKAQIVYQNLLFGWKYAFCPKGPVIDEKVKGERLKLKEAIGVLSDYLKEKGCIFFRFEPSVVLEIPNTKYQILNTKDINPRATLLLDLSKTGDELLANMHQKTRYNIRLAEKKDLTISDEKDVEAFLKLSEATAKRDGFRLHDIEHYRRVIESNISYELRVLSSNKTIATAVFVGHGDIFTYLYGASDYTEREKMAPYLLQWEGIKLGKKLGYKYYDFFGVAPAVGERLKVKGESLHNYNRKHQYAGVTRFKLGFGGVYHEDPGTFDFVISPTKYKLYSVLRFIKKMF